MATVIINIVGIILAIVRIIITIIVSIRNNKK